MDVAKGDQQFILDQVSKELTKLKVTAQTNAQGFLVTGDKPEDIQEAIRLIEAAKAHLQSSSETIIVPTQYHGALVGRAGLTIESLRADSGCSIIVPKAKEKSDKVLLRGTEEGRVRAKEAIEKMVSRLAQTDKQTV